MTQERVAKLLPEQLLLHPERVQPLAEVLASRLRSHDPEYVCGPLVEGAFIGLLVASALGLPFCYSEPTRDRNRASLIPISYPIPQPVQAELGGKRVAVVNDVINAGSAVRGTLAFGALILVQAGHSIEEYAFALYEVFPTAGFASSLVSNDLAVGFAILNTAIVTFGVACYLGPVRSGWASARGLMWLWILIELANGVTHPIMALRVGGYFPGVATAPLLFVLALYLTHRLRTTSPPPAAA